MNDTNQPCEQIMAKTREATVCLWLLEKKTQQILKNKNTTNTRKKSESNIPERSSQYTSYYRDIMCCQSRLNDCLPAAEHNENFAVLKVKS